MIKHDNICQSSGVVMGGPWQIRHLKHKEYSPKQIADITYNALFEVEKQMSHFLESSYLMKLNRTSVGDWLNVPIQTIEVFAKAYEIYHQTNGALNIGLGKEINDWGFGSKKVETIDLNHSSQSENDTDIGFEIDVDAQKIRRTKDVHFNLSSIAKGYAVDYACKTLNDLGIDNFIVEAAGEVKCSGLKDNQKWQVGLELPIPNKFLVYDYIELDNDAIATSGSYRKYKDIDGKHFCHTFDAKTKLPIVPDQNNNLLAISVRDSSCMYADAMATALFVMGGVAGSNFADKHNIPALFLFKDEQGICEVRSRKWVELL